MIQSQHINEEQLNKCTILKDGADTVFTGNSHLLDPLYFGHLSLTISSVKILLVPFG